MWWKITVNDKVFCQEAGGVDDAVFGALRRFDCDLGWNDGSLFDNKGVITYERIGNPNGLSKKKFRESIEKPT